jgi:MFS family permease
MATWMDSVARSWLIYELTNSSFQLGLVRGVQAIPILLLSPIAGSAADLYSRKTQILIAQIVDGLLYAWIAVMIVTDHIEPWHVYLTAVGLATVQSFQQPSRTAMVSDTVPAANLTNAMGLNAVVFNSARSVGPALAGLLIAAFGTAGSYSVQALFYLLATLWTFSLRAEQRAAASTRGHAAHGESFGQNIVEGWKFSWRNDEVRISLIVVSIAMLLLIPFTTLLPVFARDILQVGATGQGLLLTSMGVGALFSSVLVASLGDRMPRGLFMIGGVALYGILVVVFAASSWYALSILVMFIIGLCRRNLARVDPNRDPIVFTTGVSRPDDGNFSHDASDSCGRRHVRWRARISDRRTLGGGVDESRRYERDDRALRFGAKGARDSVKKTTEMMQ